MTTTGSEEQAWQAAGLYDPEAPEAADRRALLEYLAGEGVTTEQMVYAEEIGALSSAAGDLRVRPGERISAREVAGRAGIDLDLAARVWRAVGLPFADPDAPVYTDADIESFGSFRVAGELFGEESVLRFTRMVGASMARIAEGAVTSFLVDVEGPILEGRRGELALAHANVQAVSALAAVPPLMDTLFRHHVEAAIRRFRTARAGDPGAGMARLAVGFVDLVGYTSASQRLAPNELAALVADFEAKTYDAVVTSGGRVVKLIGDEVMFVALGTDAACDAVLTLVELFDESTAVPRAGVAVGDLLARGGDYYGSVVNLASRIADLAVPREVLVTTAVRDDVTRASGSYRFDPAGRRLLKGFDDPVELCSLGRAR